MNKNVGVLILVLLLFNSLICSGIYESSTNNSFLENPTENKFDLQINIHMLLGHLSSISAGIIKNNSVVWYNSYGLSDRYQSHKPNKDTIYKVGSISKVVTATAFMHIWENHSYDLDLDADICNYIPFDLKNPKYPDVNITFRMLLSHQSSIFEWLELSSLSYMFSDNDYSFIKEILLPNGSEYHPEYWADYPPGAEKNYSNLGYILLAYLIEQITGESFEQYCQNHIFKPLGMYNTSFTIKNLNQSNIASPYYWIGGFYIPIKKTDYLFIDPCGGLFTTVEDLSHFFIAHLNKGEFNGIRILRESTIELMHTPQFPESRWMGNNQYGLGWAIITNQNDEIIRVGHSGGMICYTSMMFHFVNDNVSVIYMVNSGSNFIANEYQIPLPSIFLQNYAYNKILLLLLEKGITL